MLKAILKPTFPKIAFLVVLLSGVCMVKFKSSSPPAHKKVVPLPVAAIPVAPPVSIVPEKTKRFVFLQLRHKKPAVKVAKKPLVTKKIAKVTPIKKIVPVLPESHFEEGQGDEVDFVSPLDEIAYIGFSEIEESPNFAPNVLLSSVQIDESLLVDAVPLEQRLAIQEGALQENTFSELVEPLKDLKTQELVVVSAPETAPAPEPELVLNTQAIPEKNPEPKAPTVLVAQNEITPTETAETVTEPSEAREAEAATEEIQVEQLEEEPLIVQTPASAPTPTTSTPTIATLPRLQPMTASVGSTASVNSQKAATVNTPEKNTLVLPTPAPNPNPNPAPDKTPEMEDLNSGNFKGRIVMDQGMASWMATNNGHAQLYLHREGNKDPQDTIFINYEPGEEDFEFESEGMQGRYHLYASIFSGKETMPVAQIQYPKVISTATYREHILFELKKNELQKGILQETARSPSQSLVLSLTIFEGAPGNYRKSSPVPRAVASIVGHPEFGTFQSDTEGNLRIPNVMPRSEYIIEVAAPGFYPTRQVVPVFDTGAYSAVYLLAKDKVESITRFFTKKEQQEKKALLMGRVYSSKTRAPLKNEELSLTFRRGGAVYFDALPNLSLRSTTETGLFGFYNIEPSFRAIHRASGKHASLLSTLPGFGYYVELGRGGEKAVKGRLLDPFHNQGVEGKVSLLGDDRNKVMTSENGKFAIPSVDLPPGVLTLEIHAENYPTVWQTIPWSPREAEKPRNLFVLEKEMIVESQKINRVSQDRNLGMILGGAEPSFFEKGRKCVRVELLDSNGKAVPGHVGPFPIAGAKNQEKGFCLSQSAPGFAFFNVPSGEYIVKWVDQKRKTFRTHFLRVGVNRASVLVN